MPRGPQTKESFPVTVVVMDGRLCTDIAFVKSAVSQAESLENQSSEQRKLSDAARILVSVGLGSRPTGLSKLCWSREPGEWGPVAAQPERGIRGRRSAGCCWRRTRRVERYINSIGTSDLFADFWDAPIHDGDKNHSVPATLSTYTKTP